MRDILFRGAQNVDGSKSLYWYEGSLVSEKDGYTGEVEYYIQNESGIEIWDDECDQLEVIGNIHDNPELLKGAKQE